MNSRRYVHPSPHRSISHSRTWTRPANQYHRIQKIEREKHRIINPKYFHFLPLDPIELLSHYRHRYLHRSDLWQPLLYGKLAEDALVNQDPSSILRWKFQSTSKTKGSSDKSTEPKVDEPQIGVVSANLNQVLNDHAYVVENSMPVILDTGASLSLTPNLNDFVGPLEKTSLKQLNGLTTPASVIGKGIVEWTIVDQHDQHFLIRTEAYYVPQAQVRLLSPQSYFTEKFERCEVTNKEATLHLSDGQVYTFPLHPSSRLPMMMIGDRDKVKPIAGITAEDLTLLSNASETAAHLSVCQETNQNLTGPQKELLSLHWKLGHANFEWIQSLMRQGPEGQPALLETKFERTKSTPAPLCTACAMGKGKKSTSKDVKTTRPRNREMNLKRENLDPGSRVSIDQYTSSTKGRLLNTKGKESADKKYTGGTIFVDHASGFIFIHNQVSLRVGETLLGKHEFEKWASNAGVKIQGYLADNHPFRAKNFVDDLNSKQQTIKYSGVGAHHQNGVAERGIRTVTEMARTMMLNAIIHWPDEAQVDLWPMAMEHAVFIYNNLPKKGTKLSPMEMFTGTKVDHNEFLKRIHTWGCPFYVLDPRLQDNNARIQFY